MNHLRRLDREESGAALVLALLAVIVLSGLVIVFVGRSLTETRASASARSFETAVHAAEAATDEVLSHMRLDDDYVTRRNGHRIEAPTSGDDERAWVRARADELVDDGEVVQTENGEAVAIRPSRGEKPVDVIYAVGAVPGFDVERARYRFLKLQVSQDRYIPEYALMTEGSFGFGGSAQIGIPGCDTSTPESTHLTCIADVHTNGDVKFSGTSANIEGRVSTAEGTCPDPVNADAGCRDASHGVAPQPVPPFNARAFYRPPIASDDDEDGEEAALKGLNPDPGGQEMGWFDLCDDGTVRKPSSSGQPCGSSEILWTHSGGNTSFRGWDWQASQRNWRGRDVGAGVFYVYNADATVNGSDGERAVTVIVEGDTGPVDKTGTLSVSGNPTLQAGMEDVLFITDRDLDLQGTASGGLCDAEATQLSGFIGVGEQTDIRGNVNLKGAIIVQDLADEHPEVRRHSVHGNARLSGNMCLEYDDDLVVDLTGNWVITYWNEI
jgi:hypothetical protein